MGELSKFLLGSLISVFTRVSKYTTWISKQYPHFYAFYWFFICWFLLFIHFSTLQPLSWKVSFYGTQKPTPPPVFNTQASDWVHCEEETGAYYQLSRITSKFVKKKKNLLLKLLFLPPQNTWFSKNCIKFINFFFKKR